MYKQEFVDQTLTVSGVRDARAGYRSYSDAQIHRDHHLETPGHHVPPQWTINTLAESGRNVGTTNSTSISNRLTNAPTPRVAR
jgi:hypothetical protein